MTIYNKVKKIVYRKVPNEKNRITKTTLKKIDFRGIEDYEKYINQMKIDEFIDFDWDGNNIDYQSVKITSKGNRDLYNY